MGDLDSEPNINMWRELRKAYPKKNKPIPTGIKNIKGKIITNPDEKKKVTLQHFEHRMRKRKIKEDAKEVVDINEKLFEERLKESNSKVTPEFGMKELDKVLKSLKTGKSKDPNDYIYELFKDGTIGSDLRKSILILMNKMKAEIKIPDCLKTANITILHKKNSKLDLNNWRGIFVTSVVRGILMKLVYERTYETINRNMSDAQIGARKRKSVRNHLFVLNAILSDVMSSKKKEPVDINVMDFKQMFDSEELPQVLNAFYESGVKDDMLALLCEANRSVKFAVKTPAGKTDIRTINNKIMQGDVMSPLMSSNFVDVNIVKPAKETGNVYMYKNKVPIPPLIMQDDTLTISACGMKTKQVNSLLNTQASTMGLQFGSSKCVKLHIGKNHNSYICGNSQVDGWSEEIVKTEDGRETLEDFYVGKIETKTVKETKYLGTIVSKDLKNDKNIKDKTNKANGNATKILTSIKERPYGKYTFKAVRLMRNGMMLGSLLNNAETWISVTKNDIKKLEKPDKIMSEKLFGVKAAQSFQYLEMGMLPVKHVIMAKRLKFWKYILDESTDTMIRQVYETQKSESRKGDFIFQIKEDLKELDIALKEHEVVMLNKTKWNKFINERVEQNALEVLVKENDLKKKTKGLKFESFKMQDYLKVNRNTEASKTIYKIRSGTFNVKAWKPWQYEDNLCIMCTEKEENINHFFKCKKYEREEVKWENILKSDEKVQYDIAKEAETRIKLRETKQQEIGQGSPPAPTTPD